MQRLVLFDLDGTLVDRQAACAAAVAGLCRAHGYDAGVEHWLLTQLDDRASEDDFARLRSAFGLEESAAQLWQEYVDLMAASVTCRPVVLKGLDRLHEDGWTIGIVTNGGADIQRAKLAASGIADLVDGIAVSGDLGVRKPDRRLFALAAARCGLDLTSGGWMIGDNPVGDIGGAHQAGLRSIWLRGHPWPPAVASPHHAVDDVVDAIDLLLNAPLE